MHTRLCKNDVRKTYRLPLQLIPEYVTDETRYTDAIYFFTQLNDLCEQFHHLVFLTLERGMESIYVFHE